MLYQLVKLAFTHVFDCWHDALNHRTFNNEPMRAFLALTILEILNLLLDALVFVLLLAQVLFKFGALFK